MRIILHIGTEKTGTTTIQHFLKANYAKLREQGILVPSSSYLLNSVSHDKLSVYARRENRPDDLRRRLGDAPLDKFRANFAAELVGECRQSRCDTAILSSEHCSSRLLFADELERLRDLLRQIGETQIVVYLRRQEELWVSYYSTAVKTRSTEPITMPDTMTKKEILDYYALCTRWCDVFGDEAIRVRVFDRREFVNGNLIDDFMATANLNVDLSSLQRPPAQNRGLNPRLLEFLRRFNRYLPHISEQSGFTPDPRQGDLLWILERLSTEDRQVLPAEWRRAIIEEFAASNGNVARRFLGRADGRLFREEETDAEQSAHLSDFTLDDAFQIFAQVWSEKNRRGSAAGAVRNNALLPERRPG